MAALACIYCRKYTVKVVMIENPKIMNQNENIYMFVRLAKQRMGCKMQKLLILQSFRILLGEILTQHFAQQTLIQKTEASILPIMMVQAVIWIRMICYYRPVKL
ncbi:hypothetical protein BBV17_28665 [Cytobacillus oceanisediminis]|uniref:Uncharacterized protein n=1 Tax=Cytobacillus oceanisediminis TaxID=665099 RepID=A0ABX3CKT2_9BACI|nr:hypothetical protein BBV17_28665 [Cytobacillus oceanisediminis]